MKKRKLTKKQEKTIENMKKNRAIDSDVLRNLIIQKLKWAEKEKQKGLDNIRQNQIQIYKLEGIILFIQSLLEDANEKKKIN